MEREQSGTGSVIVTGTVIITEMVFATETVIDAKMVFATVTVIGTGTVRNGNGN